MKLSLFFSIFIFYLGCTSPPLPVFPSKEGICPKADLILLSQPEIDIQTGNGLVGIYCKADITPAGFEWEISLVFQDEIHPSGWKDFFYRIYRRFRYGRTYDIESFLVRLEPDAKTFQLDLRNVYSGEQIFEEDPVVHKDKILSSSSLESRNSFPVLYINTWNHMFGEKDNNPKLTKQEIQISEFRFGSRSQLDGYFGTY
ncbi:surface adhesion protein Lsa23 [Leptospira sarikeiensis]|uniref:Uncharacterized protein n=1 Tax=Leptospira sarikeiensis TaxID=2484943 RepID=A0A4R9K5S6_9LEPT|nr:hypothetical protein [Leptospira sarikeiensis]TGL61589.1 hypothetical protein EHQ64_09475 [Leptospira sarikeiensis]